MDVGISDGRIPLGDILGPRQTSAVVAVRARTAAADPISEVAHSIGVGEILRKSPCDPVSLGQNPRKVSPGQSASFARSD